MSNRTDNQRVTEFNINQYVKIRLTERGRKILRDEAREVGADAEGWSTWQLWEVMDVFGPYIFNGCEVPFETVIRIVHP